MSRNLFVIPVSEEWEPHFRRTVESRISIPEIELEVASKGRLWGMEEGDLNRSTWEKMSPDDWIFFYANKEIFVASQVKTKFRHDSLGGQIWNNPSSTLLFTLERLTPVSIPIEDLRELLNYKSGYYPQGPKPVKKEKLEDLLSQYPSIESCVDYYATSTEDISSQVAELDGQTARASLAVEEGEELPIDMYLGSDGETADSKDEDNGPSLAELRKIAEQDGSETTTTTTTTTTQYDRSAAVKAYARERADGVCESCGKDAPFTSRTGEPYLEVHHVFEVSDEGPDKPNAVIALCPTCHRRVHYGEDGNKYNYQLINTLNDIESDLDLDTE